MTGRRVSLSSDLLQAALALPEETTAPADLRGSIAAAIMVTPQRPAPVRARIAATFTLLPRPVRLAISALLLAALLVGLTAVGALLFPRPGVLGDSSTFRGDVARTGVVVGPGPGAKMSIGFRTTLGGQIVSSPAVVDRMAYIGATDGTFRAFDLDRGREAWTAEVNVAWSSPSVAGDLVIVGSEDRELVALDRHTGAFAWRVPLDAFAAGSPAIHDGRIYVATSSEQSRGRSIPGATGKIVAIDLASHEILWQEDLPGPSTRSIAAQDSILVVPTDVGIAVAFDTGTGRELWRFSTEAFTDTPVIGGDTVYLAGLDLEGTRGSLWAVDLMSGAKLWPHTRPSRQTIPAPVVHADSGVVHAGTVDGDVVALRAIVPAELERDFRAAGLTHLMAVSGANLAVVLAAGLWLAGVGGAGRRVLAVVGIVLVVLLVVVTRWEPSVLRAGVMAGLVLLGVATGRGPGGRRALCLAVVVLLLADPGLAGALGFQLSVAATAGVLWLGPAVARALPHRVPERVRRAAGMTLGAQATAVPALALALGPVSLAGLPANLLGLPLAGGPMLLGVIAAATAPVAPWAATLACRLADPFLLALISVARRAAALPGGSVTLAGPARAVPAVIVLLVVVAMLLRRRSPFCPGPS